MHEDIQYDYRKDIQNLNFLIRPPVMDQYLGYGICY